MFSIDKAAVEFAPIDNRLVDRVRTLSHARSIEAHSSPSAMAVDVRARRLDRGTG